MISERSSPKGDVRPLAVSFQRDLGFVFFCSSMVEDWEKVESYHKILKEKHPEAPLEKRQMLYEDCLKHYIGTQVSILAYKGNLGETTSNLESDLTHPQQARKVKIR